jgi:PleD family two-component response regulator
MVARELTHWAQLEKGRLHPTRRAVGLPKGLTAPHGRTMAKTILIADDNDLLRRVPCEAFARESDFEVCGEAEDGQDAIDKAERLHPDLIILDLSMPG